MIKETHISIQSDMHKSSVCIDFITSGSIGKRLDDILNIIELLKIEKIDVDTIGEGSYLFSKLKEKYPRKEIEKMNIIKNL